MNERIVISKDAQGNIYKNISSFILEEKATQEQIKEYPIVYNINYYDTLNGKNSKIRTITYRGREETTLIEAERRWLYDFTYTNSSLISISKEKS